MRRSETGTAPFLTPEWQPPGFYTTSGSGV